MTIYNAVLDTQIDPDAPLTSVLMYQLRDNPLAIAEGDESVPAAYRIGHVSLGSITLTVSTL